MTELLRRVAPNEIDHGAGAGLPADVLSAAAEILTEVRRGGEAALRAVSERLGDIAPGGKLVYLREELEAALAEVSAEDRALLERTAARIRTFAEAQRQSIQPLTLAIPGGEVGHSISPVDRAGCYAPGGRFPLPSSVLMTALTARAAGVDSVWVASPRPAPITLAAAAIAGADALLAVGGAQAIGAFAFGAGSIPRCDTIVGPGNQWVTAAKKLVAGDVGIDMLAGPSELLVLADSSADPDLIAADLLAQAEHDTAAIPILISLDPELPALVDQALAAQLSTLPTAPIAREALKNGFAVVVRDLDEAVTLSDRLAPEHLQVVTRDAAAVADRCRHYGAVFIGDAAEVFGDYGAGPNHTLPTSGAARFIGGLSVLSFLRVRTWMRIDRLADAQALTADSVALAEREGLIAHARAAAKRQT